RSTAFAKYANGSYRISDSIWETHLVLPTGYLDEKQVDYICDTVEEHESSDLCGSEERDQELVG
ncbi:MAG TPA: hypothetical protein VE177_08125, partial [Candidatus Binatus sp.]|nr:hypothetical protein [Candidatus Binatus sp.]